MARIILRGGKIAVLVVLILGAIVVLLFAIRSWASFGASAVDGLVADANATGSYREAMRPLAQARMDKVDQCRLEVDKQTTPRLSLEAMRKLAMACLEAGRKAEAIDICSRMLDIKVVRTRVVSCALDVANAAHKCGDYITAKAIYKLVAERGQSENGVFAAREGLARITIASDDAGMGAKAADELWRDFKTHAKAPEVMLRVAEAVEDSGNTAKGGELYGHVAENWPASRSGAAAQKAVKRVAQGGLRVKEPVAEPMNTAEEKAMATVRAIQSEVSTKLAEGRKDEAKALAAQAAEGWKAYQQQFPTEHRAETLYMRGQCLVLAGTPAEAIACFQLIADEFPLNEGAASAQFMVGECYRRMQESGAIDATKGDNMMRKAYMRVLKNYPGGPMAKAAASKLGLPPATVKGGAR